MFTSKITGTISLLGVLAVLGGCSSPLSYSYDPYLTQDEVTDLRDLRGAQQHSWANGHNRDILSKIIRKGPYDQAMQSTKDGDFRLISVAMGPDAIEENATVFGLICKSPVETQAIAFTGDEPPSVVFKAIEQYNRTLIQQPAYPHKDVCSVDESYDHEVGKYYVK